MASDIEDIIEEIEQYVDGCKSAAFSTTKIIVNRDDLENLLEELRSRTPVEIRQYQKVISNQEAILADAKKKAEAIVAEAKIQTNELVSEHQIMQQAYAQANEVVMIATKNAQDLLDKATMDANEIRMGSIEYADSLLKLIQDVIYRSMETTRRTNDEYLSTMQRYLDKVVENRMELAPHPEATVATEESAAPSHHMEETSADAPSESEPVKVAPTPVVSEPHLAPGVHPESVAAMDAKRAAKRAATTNSIVSAVKTVAPSGAASDHTSEGAVEAEAVEDTGAAEEANTVNEGGLGSKVADISEKFFSQE
ncbi:MAG: hypothetical protein K6F00_00810 [Lachnospiraceae bacterium]|nr:hypothetical protein [Lachnospiraceae bacterium]